MSSPDSTNGVADSGEPARSKRRWPRILGRSVLVFICLLILTAPALWLLSTRVKIAGEESTPSGLRRNVSHYVTMRDGTRLAVDVWLPADYQSGERLPVLMRSTRYWRALQPGRGFRMMVLLGRIKPDAFIAPQDKYFSKRRFILVLSDMRGSGASEGTRYSEYSPDEIADLGDLASWSAAQPWSNGRVGAYGVSYEGNTAELAAVPGNPAIRAVAPLYDDFDTMLGLERPGGVYDFGMMDGWSDMVFAMDQNDICTLEKAIGWHCRVLRLMVNGVKRVDEDRFGRGLAKIVKRRNNPRLAASLSATEFRDDTFQTSKGSMGLAQITPYGLRREIEASKVAMMPWTGWTDAATTDGVLARYRTFSNPQVVVIGAFTHGGGHGTDPFLPAFDPPNPPVEEQHRMQADFFDKLLRDTPPAEIHSHIDYYTIGEGKWHSTTVWPPAGFQTQRLYFAPGHQLANAAPSARIANDTYHVDFSTSSGQHSRWLTQLGGGIVDYGDRAEEDQKLLTYTSEPLSADVEITGSPVLTLNLSSTAPDGAIHAYLEDVAPGGRVTYLTEGVFRPLHRKLATGALPYEPLGPRHSFMRADAVPMEPGDAEQIQFSLFATSLLLRKGHRVRIALAGADRDNFERLPKNTPPEWTVFRDTRMQSYLELPEKPAVLGAAAVK